MHLQCLRFKSVAVVQLGVAEKKKCAGQEWKVGTDHRHSLSLLATP